MRRVTPKEFPEIFSGSRAGSVNIVSESGLYKLIMRSNKPEAKAFQDWVTRDVLPAIRKDGGYVAGRSSVREIGALNRAGLAPQPRSRPAGVAPKTN